jgi:Flp pilus assembly protein TadG
MIFHYAQKCVFRRMKQFEVILSESNAGVSAVEFALVAPILCLILAVTIDFGSLVFTRIGLTQAVSASANYAMVHSSGATSTNGAALANSLAAIIPSNLDATITVNNGPTAQRTNGALSLSGTASYADLCYLPTGSAPAVTWGKAMTCGTVVLGGGLAGKFVIISASRSYTPLFGNYNIVQGGLISSSAIVQIQ